jgi:hypothetical protein
MSNEIGSRVRYGEAFWRAHHEAWQRSALNQRQYCVNRRSNLTPDRRPILTPLSGVFWR